MSNRRFPSKLSCRELLGLMDYIASMILLFLHPLLIILLCQNLLHLLFFSSVLSSSNNTTATATCNFNHSTYSLWHSRLGHPSVAIVGNVLRMCNIKVPNQNVSDFCTACCYGKMHKLPHPLSSHFYHNPLELLL